MDPKSSVSSSGGGWNEKLFNDPVKKHLSFGQAVQQVMLTYEFNHFEAIPDHISHYRTTVTDRISQKFSEFHGPGFQVCPYMPYRYNALIKVRQKASLHVNRFVALKEASKAPQTFKLRTSESTINRTFPCGNKLLQQRQGPGLQYNIMKIEFTLYFSPVQTVQSQPFVLERQYPDKSKIHMEVQTIQLRSAKVPYYYYTAEIIQSHSQWPKWKVYGRHHIRGFEEYQQIDERGPKKFNPGTLQG